MIETVIEWSARHRWLVLAGVLLLLVWAVDSIRKTPLDAIPDLSDPQVIVFSEWMGRSPDLLEDQVTYPLVRALQSTPGVTAVRGYSMFGMSFVYVLFAEGTDIYWARTRVLEQLGRVQQQLPASVAPTLGPDASGVGWIYQYVLEDTQHALSPAELRALQDFTVRPALQGVQGVAEVASLGGFELQYQVILDPATLTAFGLTPADVIQAVRAANAEVGARVIESGGREYVLRGRGYLRSLEDLELAVVAVGAGGAPVRLRDVATVQFGPEIRRGAADWDGRGETVGGIVVMRIGANALEVIRALERQIDELTLPEGVRLVPTYDRSELIQGSIATLRTTLIEEGIIVAAICLLFLMHARSALIAIIILPLAAVLSFIGIRYLGLTSNIMSLGGIAIAVGELADAAIVLIENAHTRLAAAPPEADRRRIIIDSCKEVGRPIFFSLLLITVSFLPIFTLTGQAGRLFDPLAYTKTLAMFAAALLSVTLAPVLMLWLLRGRIRVADANPVNRVLGRLYRPVARFAVRRRWLVTAATAVALASTAPVYWRLGSEFMPPLDEGSLLVMPTTFPGISIEEARRALNAQHRAIMGFGEVASVHGKTGRAETATDPAQLDMNESVVTLRPRAEWPLRPVARWHTDVAPDWLAPLLRALWPEQRPRTLPELVRDMDEALRMPGYQMAISPPIRTRIDMLTTGVRTPVGIKVFGPDLEGIERVSLALEGMLREVPGTRSTFAERQTGREYLDIVPNREAIARFGLRVGDVLELVETAVGGMPVSTVVDGRARYSVNVRYAADYRMDVESLRSVLVPIATPQPIAAVSAEPAGGGSAPLADAAVGSRAAMNEMGGSSMQMATQRGAPSVMGMSPVGSEYDAERWQQTGSAVPLGEIADVRIASGPPMIKDENGALVGYVFADIDGAERDLGGWVNDAKALVAERLAVPEGFRLQWTGQYEFMEDMQARMRIALPVTAVLIVALLYLSLRGWVQTALVVLAIPSALAGSIWLLALLDYNLSAAVWVGVIAVGGVAAQTGIVSVVFLDQVFDHWRRQGRLNVPDNVDAAVIEGAMKCLRPIVMTVATTVLGLMPLLFEAGVGADLSARTAAPVVGGLALCLVLTLVFLPAVYAIWRRHQVSSAAA
jgi:Cu(I)/Ag(I) efflux system membrane protein CusA/SilA